MPTSPYAKILVSVNAGANTSGGTVVPSAATIALSGENTAQWTSQLWQIYDYPLGFTAPAGWSTDGNGVIFSTAVTPPSFTLSTAAVRWGKYMLRLTVNGGLTNGVKDLTLVDESTALSMLSPNGLRDLAQNETIQFGGARSAWAAELRAILRTIDGNFGAVASTLGGDGSNFSNITGTAGIKNTSNPKVTSIEYPINVNPPGVNTAVTALTIPTSTGKVYTIRGIVAFHNSSANAYGEYEVNAFATNNVGTVTLQNNVVTQKAANVAFVVALSVSGTNILLSVTDPAGATQVRRITGSLYVAERSF